MEVKYHDESENCNKLLSKDVGAIWCIGCITLRFQGSDENQNLSKGHLEHFL